LFAACWHSADQSLNSKNNYLNLDVDDTDVRSAENNGDDVDDVDVDSDDDDFVVMVMQ
jgi:hypothetical protein